jgi:hypothetical protein
MYARQRQTQDQQQSEKCQTMPKPSYGQASKFSQRIPGPKREGCDKKASRDPAE